MLNGTTKPFIGEILELLWRNANRTEFRENDKSVPPGHKMFIGNATFDIIEHARTSMVTWAAKTVMKLANGEAEEMIKPEAGLNLRARTKNKSQRVTRRPNSETSRA